LPVTYKKTTEIVVQEINTLYPQYDCSEVEYVRAKNNITIICPEHGRFYKAPTYGYECQKCSIDRRIKAQTSSSEEFITRSRGCYGEKFDYSHVDYKTARIAVHLKCNLHNHWFTQTPYVHLREGGGGGCRLCANDLQAKSRGADKEHFIARSKATHGESTFTYLNVTYKNAKTKVLVTCSVHGDFPTYPDNHWLGAGCPDCSEAGFSSNRPGILYVMQCDNDSLTKVGITNSQLEKRRKAISKSYGKHFRTVNYYEHKSGLVINNVETELISLLREIYKQPSFKFNGYTECFYDTDLALVLNMIEDKLGGHSGKETKIRTIEREAEACTN